MATPDITGGSDRDESKEARAAGESLQKLVQKAFATASPNGQKLKNFLNDTWLPNPLHVILTDIPIGAWTTAEGGVGPSLRDERIRKNYDATIAWIKNPQPPMPKLYPSPLNEKAVDDVAAYVQNL